MSSLPDVSIPPDAVIREYAERNAALTAANVRLTVMVHELARLRDAALKQWEASQRELNQFRQQSQPSNTHGA